MRPSSSRPFEVKEQVAEDARAGRGPAHRRCPGSRFGAGTHCEEAREQRMICPCGSCGSRRGSWHWRRSRSSRASCSASPDLPSDAGLGLCLGDRRPRAGHRRTADRAAPAAQRDRVDPAGGRADRGAVLRLHPGRGLGAAVQPRAVAAALRVADRGRVRVPERAAADPPLAPGRDRRRSVLRRLPDASRCSIRSRSIRRTQAVPSPMAGIDFPDWLEWIWVPLWLGILGSLIAGAIAIRLRLRRSTGVERLQTLWVAWAASLHPARPPHVLRRLGRRRSATRTTPSVRSCSAMPIALAVAVGIAVTRYRLYAIERLVNRTAVYGTLTLLLAAAYIGITLAAGVARRPRLGLGDRGRDARRRALVPPAARAHPGRRRPPLRPRALEGLRVGAGVRERGARGAARRRRRSAACCARRCATRSPSSCSGCPRARRTRRRRASSWPPCPTTGARTRRSRARALRTAVLLHDPALLERRISLRDILAAAALSVEIARLRVEVRLQLAGGAGLARAHRRGRLRGAPPARARPPRRRAAAARLARPPDPPHAALAAEARRASSRPALDQIVGEVGSAITDLRQIAAGVRPARLDDGLAAALHDLARTMPIPVEVEAPIGRVVGERRGRGVLRRLRGAHERGQARVRVARRADRDARERARSRCASPTTASAVPAPGAAPGSPASTIASPRTAARS